VGSVVGADEGRADGAGVVFPDTYVGSNVGSEVGATVGRTVGAEVVFPGT